MKILAIETSCDETGLALVEGKKTAEGFVFTVLKQALLSQAALHAQYGGVYPNLAKREHQKNLPVLYREFAEEAFDAVAVTAGPGLEPALWQGIEFAKRVAAERGVPLWPVNHMEAHMISSLARRTSDVSGTSDVQTFELKDPAMPVLGLLISGGHTEFVFMPAWFSYQVVGETLDDAVGECFDKVARMLGLPYPGGPQISKLAQQAREQLQHSEGLRSATGARAEQFSSKKIAYPESAAVVSKLPRPMLRSGTCDVSFSGLKTAALYALRERGGAERLSDGEKAAFAAEFEEAVGDVFAAKTRQALVQTGARTFVIGGGVAANRYLRGRLEALVADECPDVELRLPEPGITGDNAVMVAQAALAHLAAGDWQEPPQGELRAVGNLSIAS